MTYRTISIAGTILLFAAAFQGTSLLADQSFSANDLEFFEKQVRPLLIANCYECHANGAREGGLQLTSRSAALRGGDTGPAVVPGDPATSLLIDAVNYGLYEMPPKSKLGDSDIRKLTEWVQRGAPWPDETPRGELAEDTFDLQSRKQAHWAWSALGSPTPPAVNDARWPLDPIDQFVLARLEEAQLVPAEPTDPAALIRRAYFDLLGLPPTPAQVDAFVAAPSQAAFATIVDELLNSPHFGERWLGTGWT